MVKENKITVFIVASVFTLTLASSPVFARGFKNGKRARVAQGVRSGEITRGEFRELRQDRRQFRRARRRAMGDGEISRGERRRLRRMNRRNNFDIYRSKNNDWDRN